MKVTLTYLFKKSMNFSKECIFYDFVINSRDFEPEFRDLFKQGVKIDEKTNDLFKNMGLEKESFT